MGAILFFLCCLGLDIVFVSIFRAFLGMLVSTLLLFVWLHGAGVAAVVAAGRYHVLSSDRRISSVMPTSFLLESCVLLLECLLVQPVDGSDIGPCKPL